MDRDDFMSENKAVRKEREREPAPTDLLPGWLLSAGCTGAQVCKIRADNTND